MSNPDSLAPASESPPLATASPARTQLLERLDAELQSKPESTAAWINLWLEVAKLGQSYLAETGIIAPGQTQMQLPTHDPWAWLAAARMSESYGDWHSAIQAYDHALSLRPDDNMTQMWRAHCLARLGRLEEADALMRSVGRNYAWPARITRMGEHFWRELDMQPLSNDGELYWEWLVPPQHFDSHTRRLQKPLGTVILIAMDGQYWERYGQRVLGSWDQMLRSVFSSQTDSDLHLHIHLMNASSAQRQTATARVQQSAQVSLCHEELVLPIAQEAHARYMREHRTWYACSRLRILPWWLNQCSTGVLVTDADISWQKNPLVVWDAVGDASAACVRFDPRARILWEDWYLTLAAFRADRQGMHIANHLAAYVDYFLRCGDGVWVLDQAALWSVFARHGASVALETPATGHIAELPPTLIRWPGAVDHHDAILETSVATQEGEPESASEVADAGTAQTTEPKQEVVLIAAKPPPPEPMPQALDDVLNAAGAQAQPAQTLTSSPPHAPLTSTQSATLNDATVVPTTKSHGSKARSTLARLARGQQTERERLVAIQQAEIGQASTKVAVPARPRKASLDPALDDYQAGETP